VPKNVSQFNLSETLKVGNKLTFCLIQRGKHSKNFIKWIASIWVYWVKFIIHNSVSFLLLFKLNSMKKSSINHFRSVNVYNNKALVKFTFYFLFQFLTIKHIGFRPILKQSLSALMFVELNDSSKWNFSTRNGNN